MKKIKLLSNLFFLIILFCTNYASALVLPDTQIVVQQIRYYSAESKEVYIVWGINDWNLQEEELRPEGTFIKDSMLYTPMKPYKDGIFVANLSVRPKTQVDYKFYITKGLLDKGAEVWDSNNAHQLDYHTIVLSDNAVLINSKVRVRPDETLTILDFSMPFLSISSTLLLMLFIIREHRNKETLLNPGILNIIFSGGAILFVVLALIRTSFIDISWDLYLQPFRYIPKLIWAGFYDLAYITIVCGIFFILNLAFGKFALAKRSIIVLFVLVGMCSILSALSTIQVTEGEKLLQTLTFNKIIQVTSVCCASFFSAIFLSYLSAMVINSVTVKYAVLSSVICAFFVYFTIAPKAVLHYSWDYEKLANPVLSYFDDSDGILENELYSHETTDSLKIELSKNTGSADHLGIAPK